jgi:hypothetical protein
MSDLKQTSVEHDSLLNKHHAMREQQIDRLTPVDMMKYRRGF